MRAFVVLIVFLFGCGREQHYKRSTFKKIYTCTYGWPYKGSGRDEEELLNSLPSQVPGRTFYGINAFGWQKLPIIQNIEDDFTADHVHAIKLAYEKWSEALEWEKPIVLYNDLSSDAEEDPNKIWDEERYNQENNIFLVNDSWEMFKKGASVLGTTVYVDSPENKRESSDIYINGDSYKVGDTITDSSVEVDLLTLVLHELGHQLGLTHHQSPDSIMYHLITIGNGLYRREIDPISRRLIKLAWAQNDSLKPQDER